VTPPAVAASVAGSFRSAPSFFPRPAPVIFAVGLAGGGRIRGGGDRIPVPYPDVRIRRGGLFGFLILMTIAGKVCVGQRPARAGGAGGVVVPAVGPMGAAMSTKGPHGVAAAQLQVACCHGCREFAKQDLDAELAETGPPPPQRRPRQKVLQRNLPSPDASARSSGLCQLRSGPGCLFRERGVHLQPPLV